MLANLGLFCLILTAVVSSCGAAVGLYSLLLRKQTLVPATISRSLSAVAFLFAGLSLLLLSYAFASDDFSLSYVSDNSNSALALPFKIAATWGGHQGSMLFWVAIISGWSVLVSRRTNSASDFHASWLMLALVAIFSWFTLLASNPFAMNEVMPFEGRDLNPMLQDIGLIIHPPLLYVGYVGFASVLGLTCGYLIEAKGEADIFERLTRHTLLAWVFLSAGIIVGAGWAYYELGWGGWWFWDPVENASLLPWLTATALVHSVMASRKQGQLKVWTFSLAIVTFCLSILGTFIVRSGVLTSVHAFAVDPSKGLTLLGILSLVFVSAYVLLIHRAASIKSNAISRFSSKNTFILWALNLFVLAMAIVLLGTFYPMLYQLLGLGNISVGAPYFNLLFAPLTIVALVAMALSPLLKWQAQSGVFPRKLAFISASVSAFLAFAFIRYYTHQDSEVAATWSTYAFITTWAALWLTVTHVLRCLRVRKQEYRYKVYLVSIAHIGVAILAFGASMNSYYSYELTAKLGPTKLGSNSEVQFGDYKIHYQHTKLYVAPNYTAEQGVIEITEPSGNSVIARPEKRHYPVRVMNMTEPSLTPYWNGDVYITLGEKIDSEHYAVRIQFKAFIRWIGIGGLLVVLAGTGLLIRGAWIKQFNPRKRRAITREYQA
ncbi:cytochrome c nitrate reductase biogenesis protein NrfE [Vibrio breoganii]|uniref:Cytochrome c nitrate reductase biogenesis protein NrfE n=1 Tax=Vibrio breoganii TaxID=553239 RepID=A0AAN0XX66_9VIBR|nr:heme lyase CcmF/NrfE family subunit [Vibrio breoganii]ANO34452.1 cytochrome c nitrate reductase biogenesis protein NrfE [Vibrio breoganii]PMG85181.1 cytochrome c nitrate reductase biogenesis protein NrfE [Vibrio breoganii]